MQITEPVTMLTDYAMGAASLFLGLVLLRHIGPSNRTTIRLWVISYAGVCIASLLGGTYHGFASYFSVSGLRALWNATIYASGFAGGCVAAGAVASDVRGHKEGRKWLIAGTLVTQLTGWNLGVGVTATDGTVTKAATTTGWNAGAASKKSVWAGDGFVDFFVVGVDLGAVLNGAFNGQMASFVIDASTGAIVDAFYADAPMNGSVVELPLLASDLGLSQNPSNPGPGKRGGQSQQFTYAVNAFWLVGGGVDSTSAATFNPFVPPVSSGDFATLPPGSATAMSLTVDKDQQKKTPALGWLVVSVDDANGAAQADEVQAPALQ